jgi:hypothetical protein
MRSENNQSFIIPKINLQIKKAPCIKIQGAFAYYLLLLFLTDNVIEHRHLK